MEMTPFGGLLLTGLSCSFSSTTADVSIKKETRDFYEVKNVNIAYLMCCTVCIQIINLYRREANPSSVSLKQGVILKCSSPDSLECLFLKFTRLECSSLCEVGGWWMQHLTGFMRL